jgi:MFS family permease
VSAAIGTASLLADLGHEVPTALLPSFLTSTLGAPAAALGFIEGVADGLAGIGGRARRRSTAPPRHRDGRVYGNGPPHRSDRRRNLRLASRHPAQAGWVARGLRVPSRNALLADVVPPTAYGRAYGFERAMDNLGAIGGPLLALGLVALVGVRTSIMLSVIPGLLAALAIFVAIRSAPRLGIRERQPIRLRVRPLLRGRLGRLLVAVSAFELGNVAATLLMRRRADW